MATQDIEIEGNTITLCANGATPHIFKRVFHKDLFKIVPDILNIFSDRGISLGEIIQSMETYEEMETDEGRQMMIQYADRLFPALSVAIEAGLPELLDEVAFVMAMQAEKDTSACLRLNDTNFIDWLVGFPPGAFLMKFMDIGKLYFSNISTSSKPKNTVAPRQGK